MSTVVIEEPWDPIENKKRKAYIPTKLGIYEFTGGFVKENKNSHVSKIIDNKVGEEVCKDINLEIYVKQEERIRDFVYCFSLNTGWEPTLNLNFVRHDDFLPYPNASLYNGGHYYSVGDIIRKDTNDIFGNYMCIEAHIADLNWYYEDKTKWIKFDTDLINITKAIHSSLYSDSFPYVGELVFKNIWGCDVSKRLKTYVKNISYLLVDYSKILSATLGLRSVASFYTKFFDRGVLKAGSNYGCRFDFGASFDADELLGQTVLNHYLNIDENYESLPSNWDPSTDENLTNNFGGINIAPYVYDHYYGISINKGIPFFKEKEFRDAQLKLFIEKTDSLGNIAQRLVNLPIHLVFYNNLIKAFKPLIVNGDLDPETVQTFVAEYKNATNVNYEGLSISGTKAWYLNIFIWCPDCERLNLSSTILGVTAEDEYAPQLLYKNGQICLLRWGIEVSQVSAGSKIYATHILEYNDGLNYDKFTLFQEVTISA